MTISRRPVTLLILLTRLGGVHCGGEKLYIMFDCIIDQLIPPFLVFYDAFVFYISDAVSSIHLIFTHHHLQAVQTCPTCSYVPSLPDSSLLTQVLIYQTDLPQYPTRARGPNNLFLHTIALPAAFPCPDLLAHLRRKVHITLFSTVFSLGSHVHKPYEGERFSCK